MAVTRRRKQSKATADSAVVDGGNSQPSTIWEPPSPRLIELSITASHVGEVSTISGSCTARLWIDVRWLPSASELENPEEGSTWDPAQNFQCVNAAETKKNEVVRAPSLKQVGDTTKWHCIIELEGVFQQASADPPDVHRPPKGPLTLKPCNKLGVRPSQLSLGLPVPRRPGGDGQYEANALCPCGSPGDGALC